MFKIGRRLGLFGQSEEPGEPEDFTKHGVKRIELDVDESSARLFYKSGGSETVEPVYSIQTKGAQRIEVNLSSQEVTPIQGISAEKGSSFSVEYEEARGVLTIMHDSGTWTKK